MKTSAIKPKSFLILPLIPLLLSSAHGVDLWSTTFTGANGANRSMVNTAVDSSFTDTLTADDFNLTFQDTTFTGSVFMHSGNMSSGTYYSPRTNVDNPGASGQNGGWWQTEFRYSGGTQSLELSGVAMEMVWSNSGGNIQNGQFAGNNFGIFIRDITLTLQYSLDDGSTWTDVAAPQTYDVTEPDGEDQIQILTFNPASPIAIDHATQDLWLRVLAENAGGNVGAYVNIKSITASGAVATDEDYALWVQSYPDANLANPNDDLDGDGLSNDEERIWGMNPTIGTNPSAITSLLDATLGTFTYSRRSPSLTGKQFRYEYSTTLGTWLPLTPAAESATGTSPNESVTVTVPAELLGSKLFVRAIAESATP